MFRVEWKINSLIQIQILDAIANSLILLTLSSTENTISKYNTMNRLTLFVLGSLLIICTNSIHAQSNKKPKLNKGSSKRDIDKRLKESQEKDDSNVFNPLHIMGGKQNDLRDDLLWHSETGNTGYNNSGNISVTNPSRFGLTEDLELYSTLGYDYWAPNLGLKKHWNHYGHWYVASKHMFYSGTTGFNWAQKKEKLEVIDPDVEVPIVLSMRNELLVSYVFITTGTCKKPKPFLILTGAIGADYGYPIVGNSLREMEYHFLTNRSPATTGSSWMAFAKLRADWQVFDFLAARGGFTYFYGDFTNNQALEHRLYGELFAFPYLSFSAGYMMSYAKYDIGNNFKIIPFADLTLYFGRKQKRQKGLWGKKGPK